MRTHADHVDWIALVLGLVARTATLWAAQGVFYVFVRNFMVFMGTPAFWIDIYAYYAKSSPLGMLFITLSVIVAHFVLGYAIAWKAVKAPLLNIVSFFIIEGLLVLLAIGLRVPGYRSLDAEFGEIIVYVLCLVSASLGGLSVRKL